MSFIFGFRMHYQMLLQQISLPNQASLKVGVNFVFISCFQISRMGQGGSPRHAGYLGGSWPTAKSRQQIMLKERNSNMVNQDDRHIPWKCIEPLLEGFSGFRPFFFFSRLTMSAEKVCPRNQADNNLNFYTEKRKQRLTEVK